MPAVERLAGGSDTSAKSNRMCRRVPNRTSPRPGYDPQRTTLAEREQTEADELTAFGQQVGVCTIRRKRAAYAASGLWRLVDARAVKPRSATGRSTSASCSLPGRALAEQTATSTGTRGKVRRRVRNCWTRRTPRRRPHAPVLNLLPAIGRPQHRRAHVRRGGDRHQHLRAGHLHRPHVTHLVPAHRRVGLAATGDPSERPHTR
jgi:hypothetical protein